MVPALAVTAGCIPVAEPCTFRNVLGLSAALTAKGACDGLWVQEGSVRLPCPLSTSSMLSDTYGMRWASFIVLHQSQNLWVRAFSAVPLLMMMERGPGLVAQRVVGLRAVGWAGVNLPRKRGIEVSVVPSDFLAHSEACGDGLWCADPFYPAFRSVSPLRRMT